MRPLRSASICVSTPTYSSGTSIVRRSTGSWRLPSISRMTHLRLADGELEALAAHHLDEDRELQLAAALDLPRVRALGRQHADRDVADRLGGEAVLDLAGGQLAAVQARQRRVVDADRHRDRRLVDGDHRQRSRIVGIGERLADGHVGEPGDGDDLARPGLGGVDAVERLGHVELGHARGGDRAVGPAPRDLLALADRAVAHAADREPSDVGRGVEVRHVRLQRLALLVLGRRDRAPAAGPSAAAASSPGRSGVSEARPALAFV